MSMRDNSLHSRTAHEPLVTLAIPTFNRASWLNECVRSALAQSYQNFEVVVSDNASTDETAEVLRRIDSPKLRVLRQETNIGPVPNWNACLAAAKGDYIVFVSDDDRIAPWLLERCMALVRIDSHLPVVLALGDIYFASQRRTTPAVASQRLNTGIWNGLDVLQEFLDGRISPQTCTILFRTEELRANGGFPLDWPHVGDIASWISLLRLGKVGLINERCGTYCDHSETQSSGFNIDTRLADLRKLINLILATAQSVSDLERRHEIELQCRSFLARHAFGIIVSGRKQNVSLSDLLSVIWQWRKDLIGVKISDAIGLIRPMMILLLPVPVSRQVRKFLQMLRRFKAPPENRKEYQEVHQQLGASYGQQREKNFKIRG